MDTHNLGKNPGWASELFPRPAHDFLRQAPKKLREDRTMTGL